ncbi:MAG: LemA family protein [Sphingomonadales bacterium]|jgi:LemA protein|nr:LemA family protein [Sphingomonadales bacterium]MBK9003130.1 LemA family protein [Sphingomonadales bacterium]MBK9268378.1 LemA family protein [Sphingomonadales bacterium]MBP6434895.1 LemA family protein [Sphingorhabdus sp.]
MRSDLAKFLLVPVAAVSVAGCGINSVPTAEENAKAKWADVQAAFQERANLIPNLAAVVKGAAAQESKTLTEVIEARAKATSVTLAPGDLNDPAKMAAFQTAQNNLSGSLSRLLVSVEQYPQLKSQEGFLKLQDQLEGQENRIRITLRDYNEAVRQYNTTIRTFPDIIGAKVIHGAKPMVPYEAATPGAEVAPKLDMAPTG